MLKGMTEDELAKYGPLLAEALDAYRADSSYAEDMVKQANIILARIARNSD